MVKDELLGKQLGSYQLIELLGHGAFGSVYLGKHYILSNKPLVAIKVLNATLSSQDEYDRFFQEAMMLDALSHPHILPVMDASINDGYPFFVAVYAAGGSLRDHMDQAPGHPFPLDEALDVLNQIAQGLQFAHDHNIVHRDLKPANILFDAEGNALLADFGIAMPIQKTRHADEIGTPAYMAPEQFKGKVSKRSDQYALACIAYELVTGQPLFDAEDPFTIAYQHVHEAPVPPGDLNPEVTPEIEAVILKALSKQRNDRFPSVTDFIEALYNATSFEPQSSDEQGDALYGGELDEGVEYYDEPEDDNDYYPDKQPAKKPSVEHHAHDARPPAANRVPPRAGRANVAPRLSTPTRTTPPLLPTANNGQKSGRSNEQNTGIRPDATARRAQPTTPRQATHMPGLTPLWAGAPDNDHTYYAEPTLANGIVYTGIYSTNAGDQAQLNALSIANGSTLWTFDTDYGIYDAPVVSNGTVYFCAGNINNGGTVYAVDSDTGELLWDFETEEYLKATPTIANDIVYAYSQHAIFALNAATGQRYWNVTLKAAIFGHPYVVDDVVYIATERGNCYAVDANHGQKIATFSEIGEMHAAVTIDERTYGLCVYEDQFYALDMTSGDTRWSMKIDRHISGGITVAGSYAILGSHSGFVGDSARTRLLAIDINSGRLLWGAHIKHEIEGAPVVDGKYIYLSNFGREINILDTQQGQLLFAARVGRGKLSRPSVENNRLILSTGELNAFKIE
ncbi:serine/threonine-protein kinase [Ktedonobacteria bacterium brp13]|nr:serine/threonine-protein kinase [Ktedonobacteria bacterium brp13]